MTLTTSQTIALRWSSLYLASPHCGQPISSKWLKQFSLSDLLQHLLSCASWRISTRKRLRCKVWTAGTCLLEKKHTILNQIYCKTIVLRLNIIDSIILDWRLIFSIPIEEKHLVIFRSTYPESITLKATILATQTTSWRWTFQKLRFHISLPRKPHF